jgi:hypothetical protein
LFEAVLSDAFGRVGEGLFVEGLEAEMVVVESLE